MKIDNYITIHVQPQITSVSHTFGRRGRGYRSIPRAFNALAETISKAEYKGKTVVLLKKDGRVLNRSLTVSMPGNSRYILHTAVCFLEDYVGREWLLKKLKTYEEVYVA